MANAADIEKVREIDKGIENAKRFESDFLQSGVFSPEDQKTLLSTTDSELVKILEEKGFMDTTGLIQARKDYFLYRDVPLPELSQPEIQENQGKVNPTEAAAALLGLGMIPFMKNEELTPELLENLSKDYAEKAAAEWNKTKDSSKAKNYFHAYELAQQDYFDRLAYSDPKKAKKLASVRTQKFIDKAIKRNNLLRQENIKEFVPRTFTPDYEKEAENRLRMIDKLSEMRAKDPTVSKDLEREKLLRAFADDNPVALNLYLDSQKKQGKSVDPLIERVVAEKMESDKIVAKKIEKSIEKHEAGKPAPPQKPKKISKIRKGFNRLNNLRPSNLISSGIKKAGSSILSLLTRLLKKSLIGGIIGALSSLISGAISGMIAVGSAIGVIIGAILVKITLGIAALLSLSISAVISLVATIALLSIGVFIFITLFSVLREIFPSPSPGIAYSISGPERVANGELIHNRIGFFYFSDAPCAIEGITLVDSLPFASDFSSASGKFTTTPDPEETVKWKISENTPALVSSEVKQYVFEVYHKPLDDIVATSKISLEGIENCEPPELSSCAYEENNLTCGSNDSPSALQCNGTDGSREVTEYAYDILTLSGELKRTDANFGDPKCSITKEKLENLIRYLDPENLDSWMKIAECRSHGAGPNAYYSKKEDRESRWGLFGMGRSKNLFEAWNPTDPPDRGDVPWQKQVQNAIAYNNANGGNFAFPGWQDCLK